MFGYLYAIQNGAEWIYDTDDDNQPIGEGLAQFDAEITTKGLTYGLSEKVPNKNATMRRLFNPYAFWGQKTVWPRGFPLENIQEQNDPSAFFLCERIKTPAIQQGLVTKDPDVDAIYRLLQADKFTGLNTFEEHCVDYSQHYCISSFT
uniref:Uncharacterized protein n=1 Tax=Plectus sambesii TaxID=2011161 RepID=A0A914X6I5_9BILA